MASPKPGGYIAKGGVFDFKRPLDYLDAGKAAGKFAWNKKFESELSGKQQNFLLFLISTYSAENFCSDKAGIMY